MKVNLYRSKCLSEKVEGVHDVLLNRRSNKAFVNGRVTNAICIGQKGNDLFRFKVKYKGSYAYFNCTQYQLDNQPEKAKWIGKLEFKWK